MADLFKVLLADEIDADHVKIGDRLKAHLKQLKFDSGKDCWTLGECLDDDGNPTPDSVNLEFHETKKCEQRAADLVRCQSRETEQIGAFEQKLRTMVINWYTADTHFGQIPVRRQSENQGNQRRSLPLILTVKLEICYLSHSGHSCKLRRRPLESPFCEFDFSAACARGMGNAALA